MLNALKTHLTYANAVSSLALFLVLGGGAAYASHLQVFSSDIVDGEVKSADVGNGQVKTADVADGSLTSADVQNNALTPNDIAPNSIPTGRILDDTLTGADVKNNALKGTDVDEASLSGALIPGIATSGLVKSSGVVRADVPAAEGAVTSKPLLSSGPFSVVGLCFEFREANTSQIRLTSSAANWSIDSDADLGDNLTDATGGGANLASQSGIESSAERPLDAGDYAAVAPGKLLSGEAVAGVNIMGSDCAWAVTGIG